jgi:hypothetical protein
MKKLNQYFDHTILKPEATEADVLKLCSEAKEFEFYAVCVNSCYVPLAKEILDGSSVKIASVIGFPLGACSIETKAFETDWACLEGADEIDMVIHVGALKDERYDYVSDGIIFENLTDALDYLDKRAAQNGQEGPRLMFWHGTVRSDNPLINQGCGLPLYYKICEHYYGRLGAYYYTFTGMIFPYLNSPYRNFEIMNSAQLQYDYNHGLLGTLVVD